MTGPARITADDLRDRPTLATGQADSLKIDTGQTRYWLCRCGIADGMPYDDQVTVERLIDGRWETVDTYPG
jgi:CDGSH-type Zn-finger protein